MKKKNANPRGYFGRLAQPLLPGEPVLKTRRSAPSGGVEFSGPANAVPVIEDQFEFARHAAAASPSQWRVKPDVSSEAAAAVLNYPEQVFTVENPRMVSAPEVFGGGENGMAAEGVAPKSSGIPGRGAVPAASASRDVKANSVNEQELPSLANHGLAEREASAARDEVILDRASAAVAPSSRVASQVGPEIFAVHEQAPALREDSKAETNTGSFRPASETDPVRAVEGRRVHIGTVEVRAVLPPSQVPAPVPSVARPEVVPLPRRLNADEPIGRGLSWSYGLIQG